MKKKPEQLSLTSLFQSRNNAESGRDQAPVPKANKPISLSRVRFERSRDLLIEQLDKSGIFPNRKA